MTIMILAMAEIQTDNLPHEIPDKPNALDYTPASQVTEMKLANNKIPNNELDLDWTHWIRSRVRVRIRVKVTRAKGRVRRGLGY